MSSTLKDQRKLVNVLECAVRHCPHCKDFWLQLHLERERSGDSLANIQKMVERGTEALQKAGAKFNSQSAEAFVQELLLQHANSCRRAATASQQQEQCWTQMRETFEHAVSLSEKNSSENGLSCQVLLQWMRFEAFAVRSTKWTMDVGNRLMKVWGGYYNVWSAFIAAVRFCTASNSYSTVSDLYRRAVEQVIDYPSQIRDDHVQFELEAGTLQSWCDAREAATECRQAENAAAASSADSSVLEVPLDGSQAQVVLADQDAQVAKKRSKPNLSGQEKKKRRRAKQVAEAAAAGAETSEDDGLKEASSAQEAAPAKTDDAAVAVPDGAASSHAKAAPAVPVLGGEVADGTAGNQPLVAAPAASAATAPENVEAAIPPKNDAVPAGRIAEPVEARVAVAAEQPLRDEAAATAKSSTALPEPKEAPPSSDLDPAASVGNAAVTEESAVTGQSEATDASVERANAEAKVKAHAGSHYHQKRLAAGDSVPLQPEAEGEQTVYVSNLDWSVDEAQLQRQFDEVPGMKEVRLVRDFLKRSKGYAYIDFEKPEQVSKAVEKFNGHMINKRAMFVARSRPTKPLFEERTIFVKNIGASATESDIRDAFSVKGAILGVRMPVDDTSGQHKGYAYVEFSTADSTSAALELNGLELGGQRTQVTRSIPMKNHRHQTAAPRKDIPQRSNQRQILQGKLDRQDPVRQAEHHSTTIYVKNLAFSVDESKLRDHFAECGEVKQVLLTKNAQGRSRGFGFVEFATKEQAQSALAYNDSVLCGRELWISKSVRAITQKGARYGVVGEEKAGPDAKVAKDANPNAPKSEDMPPTGKRRLDVDDKDVKAQEESVKAAKTQFRTVQNKPAEEKLPAGNAVAERGDDQAVEAPKPLSNADFRKMLLQS